MNGRDLTLGLVGALAVGAVLGRRGSRSVHRVYHLTYSFDLPGIARHGLAPRPDTQAAWDNEPGVYFVNTFGYQAGAPESEEPAWLRLPAPRELPASFWEYDLQEGRTSVPFLPDTIEVWVDAKGRPAAFADGVAWKPLREVVSAGRGSRATVRTPASYYMEGACDVMGIALHRLTGLPISAIWDGPLGRGAGPAWDPDSAIDHVVVMVDEHRYLDATGIHTHPHRLEPLGPARYGGVAEPCPVEEAVVSDLFSTSTMSAKEREKAIQTAIQHVRSDPKLLALVNQFKRDPKARGSRAATTAPVVLYHGAQRWEGAPEIVAHRKGHAEHGPGIYLTTSYETAARYAKGGGSVYRMELRPGVRWLQDAKLDKGPVLRWLKGLSRLRGKEQLVAGIERVASRMGDTFPAEILVNQFVNAGASSGQHGPALAAFLVENGVDASLTSPPLFGGSGGAHGEDWVVIFNPRIIESVTKVPAREVGKQAPFNLPRVKR